MDVELVQYLRGDVVVVPEERQEEVFRAYDVRLVELCLEIRNLQYFFGLFRERDVPYGERSPEVLTVSSIAFLSL